MRLWIKIGNQPAPIARWPYYRRDAFGGSIRYATATEDRRSSFATRSVRDEKSDLSPDTAETYKLKHM